MLAPVPGGCSPGTLDAMSSTRLRRALVVDDNEAFAEAACSVVGDAGFDVVGRESDGEAAVDAAVALHPDLVLLDVRLPRLDGPAACRRMRERGVTAPVLLMSTYAAEELGLDPAAYGADAFVTKDDLDVGWVLRTAG